MFARSRLPISLIKVVLSGRLPTRSSTSVAVISGRSWTQVTNNEGYRVIWSSTSHAGASGSILEIQALYAPNTADTSTNINYYNIPGTGTIYWRVAALVNGSPQEWSDESYFSA